MHLTDGINLLSDWAKPGPISQFSITENMAQILGCGPCFWVESVASMQVSLICTLRMWIQSEMETKKEEKRPNERNTQLIRVNKILTIKRGSPYWTLLTLVEIAAEVSIKSTFLRRPDPQTFCISGCVWLVCMAWVFLVTIEIYAEPEPHC